MTGFEWPWLRAARIRQAERDARHAKRIASRDAVKAAVTAAPYRVTQNSDGTWCAWRAYANSQYFYGCGFHDFVSWVKLDRAEAMPTRAAAEAAVRRHIAGRVVVLDAKGKAVTS